MIHYWSARLVQHGPYVGVMTWHGAPVVDGEELDRSHRWQALVRNETTSRAILQGDHVPVDVDGIFLREVEPITKAQYQHLVAHSEWSTKWAPDLPDASPTTAVDVTKLKSIF